MRINLLQILEKEKQPKKALVIYAGSISGGMTGGEYAMSKMVEILKERFEVDLMLFDNWASRIKSRAIRHLLRTVFWSPVTVLYSYLVYSKYDLVLTSWTPDFLYYGDLCYVQPFAGAKDLFYNPEHDFTGIRIAIRKSLRLPNFIVKGASTRRHLFAANSKFVQTELAEMFRSDSVVVYPPTPSADYFEINEKENTVLTIGRVVSSRSTEYCP